MADAYPVGFHQHWEDSYTANVYATFAELWEHAQVYWVGGLAPLNWPVWAEYDAGNEADWDCGPTVSVGVFMPRHGDCSIHIAPATPEQHGQVRRLLLDVWARRADVGFVRYGRGPEAS